MHTINVQYEKERLLKKRREQEIKQMKKECKECKECEDKLLEAACEAAYRDKHDGDGGARQRYQEIVATMLYMSLKRVKALRSYAVTTAVCLACILAGMAIHIVVLLAR